MRNLSEVIEEMLAVVPAEQIDLRDRLKATKQSSLYAAPEMRQTFWHECRDHLVSYVGKPKEEWQKQVASIFSTHPNIGADVCPKCRRSVSKKRKKQ